MMKLTHLFPVPLHRRQAGGCRGKEAEQEEGGGCRGGRGGICGGEGSGQKDYEGQSGVPAQMERVLEVSNKYLQDFPCFCLKVVLNSV